MSLTALLFILVGLVALAGAVLTVITRDVMRLILGLGIVLLGVAGLFALSGAAFLAVAEIFVYVGGVLVLFLFAIMLVHRSEGVSPVLTSRHDVLSLVVAVGTFFMIVALFQPVASRVEFSAISSGVAALSKTMLGSMLVHFEAAGILLLSALVAVVAILGDDRR